MNFARAVASVAVLAGLLGSGPGFLPSASAQQAPSPVTGYPLPISGLQVSGTITSGGVFQVLDAARTGRRSLEFYNLNSADTCWLHIGPDVATTANSLPVIPGAYYLRSVGTIPSDQISVTCTTTADTFYARVQ